MKKDTGLNIIASAIRAWDSKDLESMMLESGWGYLKKEFEKSILAVKHQELEKKAK